LLLLLLLLLLLPLLLLLLLLLLSMLLAQVPRGVRGAPRRRAAAGSHDGDPTARAAAQYSLQAAARDAEVREHGGGRDQAAAMWQRGVSCARDPAARRWFGCGCCCY
jgi:hypothetical protein